MEGDFEISAKKGQAYSSLGSQFCRFLPKSSISGASLSVIPTRSIDMAKSARAVTAIVHFARRASFLSVNPNRERRGRGLGRRLRATAAASGTAVARPR